MKSFGNTPSQNNWIFSNESQKESLLNEMRGNLFEYLFAKYLANHFKILGKFERGLNPELSKQFQTYQSYILQYFPELPAQLAQLAKEAANEFLNKTCSIENELLPKEISLVEVVGKVTGQSGKSQEADILLFAGENEAELGISLKMMHVRGYVNTKSGGAQSFVEKYFQGIDKSADYQDRFFEAVQSNYDQIVQKTCQILEIPTSSIASGDWKDYLSSKLPGQQPPEVREHIHLGYNKMIKSLYEIFLELNEQDPEGLRASLLKLFGMTGDKNVSVMCYYSQDYGLDGMDILTKQSLSEELKSMQIQAEPPTKSSFTVETTSYSLQVRIKPMNEFTVPSYKINCSVKKKNW
jgi:hypothetical protein